jgi:RNA recognition motif-containing protein
VSYGEIIESKVIADRDTGRSRGFGFVTFVRDEVAKMVISKMHGSSLDDRTITVNEVQEKGPRQGMDGGGRNR